jgi:Tfp pilus assembly protein PilE
MGQQQLLLVILVTIIVGIATIVAINVFSTSAASANKDSVRQDVLVIASTAQGYYIKPAMMGGGNNTFTGMTFRDINFPAESISGDGMSAYNLNGTYTINTDAGNTFTVTAYLASDPNYSSSDPFTQSGVETMTATVAKNDIDWSDIEEETTP